MLQTKSNKELHSASYPLHIMAEYCQAMRKRIRCNDHDTAKSLNQGHEKLNSAMSWDMLESSDKACQQDSSLVRNRR